MAHERQCVQIQIGGRAQAPSQGLSKVFFKEEMRNVSLSIREEAIGLLFIRHP